MKLRLLAMTGFVTGDSFSSSSTRWRWLVFGIATAGIMDRCRFISETSPPSFDIRQEQAVIDRDASAGLQ